MASFFMAIGHTIRTDSSRETFEQYRHAQGRTVLLPANFRYPRAKPSKGKFRWNARGRWKDLGLMNAMDRQVGLDVYSEKRNLLEDIW